MAPVEFSARESEIMAKAWQCFESDPKVDYNKLAALCGFTNPRSASNAWSNIKKKLASISGNVTDAGKTGQNTPTKHNTPKKSTPKKRTTKETDCGAEVDEEDESPTKKAKARKGSASPIKQEVMDDAEVGHFEFE